MEIKIEYYNDVYVKIKCEKSIAKELSEAFSFKIPGSHFIPSVRNKLWDGIIRLFNLKTYLIYGGLKHKIKEFADQNGYSYEEDSIFSSDIFSVYEANEYVNNALKTKLTPYDYQMEAFIRAIRYKRQLFLSPTNSGKSFIIFLIAQYLNVRTLVVVPKVGLVKQLTGDFMDYDGLSSIYKEIHPIMEGSSKTTNKRITISTWQSIYKQPQEWFEQFDLIIGDEAHNFKADSLKSIMEKTERCKYKFGFTGTLDGTLTNKMVLEGLFGPVYQVTTNKELIDRKISAELNIKSIILDYPDEIKKAIKGSSYQEEVDFIIQSRKRNNFIADLAHSLDGNVMILFRYIDKHGFHLHEMIQKKNKDRSGIYYIYGKTDSNFKDEIRGIIDNQKKAIVVASTGTFSEGVNIKNLNYIIFASPSKSRIKVLQSIGRGLRISNVKTEITLFDIADNLSWKSHMNHTLKHYAERVKMYNEEKFKYKQYKIRINT